MFFRVFAFHPWIDKRKREIYCCSGHIDKFMVFEVGSPDHVVCHVKLHGTEGHGQVQIDLYDGCSCEITDYDGNSLYDYPWKKPNVTYTLKNRPEL